MQQITNEGFYFLLIDIHSHFPEKKALTFHMKCLLWNVMFYSLREKKKENLVKMSTANILIQ